MDQETRATGCSGRILGAVAGETTPDGKQATNDATPRLGCEGREECAESRRAAAARAGIEAARYALILKHQEAEVEERRGKIKASDRLGEQKSLHNGVNLRPGPRLR